MTQSDYPTVCSPLSRPARFRLLLQAVCQVGRLFGHRMRENQTSCASHVKCENQALSASQVLNENQGSRASH
jgi:hypothetical protein